ncbi:uracil-xanthine permease family protein [Pelagicoccus albus]|uniref:Purine/pyrimidine permease n=1 Tax=Pelagicoccus albus TaxID=415222 RepID=A0A7X1B9A9_9BACT|nr:solute carrier family 23 protein [Pelagicoccus albus]MBC2607922.1 purine/pyrimidine permease [Pelagicoccus albus]
MSSVPNPSASDPDSPKQTLHYKIEESPKRFSETLFYAWQHTMVDISPFVIPLAVASAVGMSVSGRADLINACLFTMGIATILQTTIGNRLPIIQGCSAMVTGVIAPVAGQIGLAAVWGGVWIASILQTIVGALGWLSPLKKLFPPVVIGTVIICIALSLGQVATRLAVGSGHWSNFAFATTVILFVLILQLRFQKLFGGLLARGAILLSILLVGLVGGSLSGQMDWSPVREASWFAIPKLFPYGGPGFGWEWIPTAIFAVTIGFIGSIVESLGDYAATCAASDEPLQKRHINRGIMAEGAGSFIASLFGGLPCTSYTQNIGVIAATGVASRRVVQVAALILALYGLCPKFGTLLVSLPRSVLGGVFLLVCAMIAISGIRVLAQSTSEIRHAYTIGLTVLCSLLLPIRLEALPDATASWPLIVRLLVTSNVVLAIIFAVGLNAFFNLLDTRKKSSRSNERELAES